MEEKISNKISAGTTLLLILLIIVSINNIVINTVNNKLENKIAELEKTIAQKNEIFTPNNFEDFKESVLNSSTVSNLQNYFYKGDELCLKNSYQVDICVDIDEDEHNKSQKVASLFGYSNFDYSAYYRRDVFNDLIDLKYELFKDRMENYNYIDSSKEAVTKNIESEILQDELFDKFKEELYQSTLNKRAFKEEQ